MKRFSTMLMVMVLAAIMLVGCGIPASLGETAKKDKVTLNFYYWDEIQSESTQAIIKAFEAKYDYIKVVPTVIPWGQYWTKLQTSLPTSSGPDVFWMNDRAPEFISADLLMDLQAMVDDGRIDLSKFPEALSGLFTVEGKLYGVPKDYNTVGVYYNKALFDAAGVEYPANDWTWDDLLAAAQKLTNADTKQYGIAATTSGQTCVNNFIMQNGGMIASDEGDVTVNTPEVTEAIQFLHDMIFVHKVSPTAMELTDNPADVSFLSGKLAMFFGGSWSVKDFYEVLGDNLGIAPMPQKKEAAIVISGLAFVGSANTAHPEETQLFLEFCATQEAQEKMITDVIPAYEGADILWAGNFPEALPTGIFVEAAQYGKVVPPFKGNNNSVKTIFFAELNKAWAGEKDVVTALADAETAMNAEIDSLTK